MGACNEKNEQSIIVDPLSNDAHNLHSTEQRLRTVTLSNGTEMPSLGFGSAFGNWTDKSKFMGFQPDLGWAGVNDAFEAGFRHFDGALVYGSHKVLGTTLGLKMAAGAVKRDDLWITTKVFHPEVPLALNSQGHAFDFIGDEAEIKCKVAAAIEKSLDELSVGYVDLMLMHWPGQFETTDEARGRELRKWCWEVFEQYYEAGRLRAIGVSNFGVKHLTSFLEDVKVKPMVNQIEVNPYILQKDVLEFCKEHDIVIEAWAPFGSGATGVLTDPVIVSLADKYKKNVGQIILRWLVQQGMAALPKSSNLGRMRGNLDVFDFEISEEDMAAITSLDQNKSSVATSENIA